MTTTSIDRRPGDMLDALADPQPTREEARVYLLEVLPRVADASPVGDNWDQARRELSAILHWDLNAITFVEAVELGNMLARILDGDDMRLMFGHGEWIRDSMADHYQGELSAKINQLVSGIER